MFRSQCLRLINLYSNRFKSNLIKPNFDKYSANVLALSHYSSDIKFGNFNNNNNTNSNENNYIETESTLSRNRNFANNLVESRERRLQWMKRSSLGGDYDILTEAIIKCSTIDQIFELISLHHSVMNNRHLTETFETLHDIMRASNNFNEDSIMLLSSQQFKLLCNRTMKKMRYFQPHEILTTLKTLLFIQISPKTMIIQSLLQMARQLINDFSLDQIIFLDFLLDKKMTQNNKQLNLDLEVTTDEFNDKYTNELSFNEHQKQSIIPLVDALKLALPLVLQVKIESKELDFDDISLVTKCLRMGSRHNVKDQVINKLVAAVSIKLDELSVMQMFSVIASLTHLHYPHLNINTSLVERVVKECLDRVTKPGVVLPINTPLNFIISLITYSKDRHVYYHKGLFELVANLVVNNQNKIDISRACSALWALTKHGHVHYGLNDFVAERIASRDQQMLSNNRISFVNILSAFSLPSNYKPNNCDVIYESILETPHVDFCRQKTKHLLFKMLKSFSLLNYYNHNFLSECILNYLDDAIDSSTINGSRIDILQTLLPIYQGLCLESSNSSHDEDCKLRQKLKPYIEEMNALQSEEFRGNFKSESLHKSLTQGMGGKQFVANNIFNEFGHFIDHLVVMRKGGYPIAIGEREEVITHIKDLKLPVDSKIIGIIPITYRNFCREPCILRAETDFKFRTMKRAGITPIPINIESWDALLEHERIPFLMREIQETSQSDAKQTNIS